MPAHAGLTGPCGGCRLGGRRRVGPAPTAGVPAMGHSPSRVSPPFQRRLSDRISGLRPGRPAQEPERQLRLESAPCGRQGSSVVEQGTHKPLVVGSNPTPGTLFPREETAHPPPGMGRWSSSVSVSANVSSLCQPAGPRDRPHGAVGRKASTMMVWDGRQSKNWNACGVSLPPCGARCCGLGRAGRRACGRNGACASALTACARS